MTDLHTQRYTIGELADAGGVSRRTVRYYVQRGLVAAPVGLGRSAHYGPEHLERLIRVRELQQAGVALDAIAARLDAAPVIRATNATPSTNATPPVQRAHPQHPLAPSHWRRLVLADGVELNVRDGALNPHTLDALMRSIEASLASELLSQEENDVR